MFKASNTTRKKDNNKENLYIHKMKTSLTCSMGCTMYWNQIVNKLKSFSFSTYIADDDYS